ncbi:MAG: hypothetical protein HQL50_06595, partial [Magnetococcales bacterium]|nr:hypothetical protein [Magnetococcales bacterium]
MTRSLLTFILFLVFSTNAQSQTCPDNPTETDLFTWLKCKDYYERRLQETRVSIASEKKRRSRLYERSSFLESQLRINEEELRQLIDKSQRLDQVITTLQSDYERLKDNLDSERKKRREISETIIEIRQTVVSTLNAIKESRKQIKQRTPIERITDDGDDMCQAYHQKESTLFDEIERLASTILHIAIPTDEISLTLAAMQQLGKGLLKRFSLLSGLIYGTLSSLKKHCSSCWWLSPWR